MNQKKNKKIALIGPEFFSYMTSINNEIRERGMDCCFFDERYSNSLLPKILYRFNLSFFISYKKNRHINNIMTSILRNKIEHVVLICVETIKKDHVALLRRHNIKTHLYMWDSFSNKKSAEKLLALVDSKSSFDPLDCERYSMEYIPLFAENIFKNSACEIRDRKGIFFSGTMHSNRSKILYKLEKLKIHITKKIYYYSKLTFLMRCVFDLYGFFYIKKISSKKFSKIDLASSFSEAMAVLDIHHPKQCGLTMRTFEALRSGAWLITFNKTIKTLPENFLKRIVLIRKPADLCLKKNIILAPPDSLTTQEDYFLSIERFVDDLFRATKIEEH